MTELHTFDIKPVIVEIDKHALKSYSNTRAMELISIDTNDTVGIIQIAKDSLIDDFICYAINSFQICWVSHANLLKLTREEIDWFNSLVKAKSVLYDVITFPINASGRYIKYFRVGTTVHIIFSLE